MYLGVSSREGFQQLQANCPVLSVDVLLCNDERTTLRVRYSLVLNATPCNTEMTFFNVYDRTADFESFESLEAAVNANVLELNSILSAAANTASIV